jgi:hypothetical protein
MVGEQPAISGEVVKNPVAPRLAGGEIRAHLKRSTDDLLYQHRAGSPDGLVVLDSSLIEIRVVRRASRTLAIARAIGAG